MKKRIIIVFVVLINLVLISFLSFKLYSYLRIKYAKIEVNLKDDLTLEFNDKKRVSDYIDSINGDIINNYVIDSTKLGKKEINFKYINEDGIKLDYSYEIKVVDTIKPIIWLSNSYSIAVGSKDTMLDDILCGDNYDDNPKCEIIGEYNLDKVGNYDLVFKATDNSGNTNEKQFNLKVYEPSNSNYSSKKTYTYFSDIKEKHKTKNTKIGLDISEFQGDVDFEKLKDAGVEFVILRIGGTKGTNKDYFMDSKFKKNIKGAKENDIDVGIYFFSYSNSKAGAIKDAKWVIKNLKKYDIDLPVAYDWEDWSDYNSYHLSFYHLTNMAEGFLNELKKAGYDGMLYGSKNYLEEIWLKTSYDIWLAHYTDETNYKGKYKFWQLCSDGIVDGINGYVDIDIMYE